MEYKKSIPVALVILALSFMLLFADNIEVAYAIEQITVSGLTNVRNVQPYTTGGNERVFVLRDSNPIQYSVYQYSNSTGTPSLNLLTSGNILLNGVNSIAIQNYVHFAEDSARLWFGARNGTGDDTGYLVSFNKATNSITSYAVGRCGLIYPLMVGSELFASALQSGTTGTVCTQVRQIVSYDTNTLVAGGTVNVPVWNSGLSESGNLCNSATTNIIVMVENSPASPRVQPINYVTHTLGTRFGSGTSAYNGGCTFDGSFNYGLRGDGTIDKFTGSAMTTTGWKSGLGSPLANAGTNMDYKSGQIYVSSSANIYTINTSDAVTVAQYPNANANAQTLASQGVFYWLSATTINRVKDQIVESDITGEGAGGSGGNAVNGVCGNGSALDCVGDRGAINAITGAPAITETVNELGNGLGIFNSTNTDIKTNGTGLLLMLMTGTFFASALLGTVHQLNAKGWISANVKDIDPIFWLFLVVGVVSFAFYLQWIPDIVFYGMVVGLAGLFTFGIYKHIKGGE